MSKTENTVDRARPSRRREASAAWICAALAALTVAVFAGVRDNGFVTYDDGLYVLRNPWVARGLTWDGVRWALTAQWAGNWHPATWLSHMLDVQLFGMNPGAMHLVNLGFHVADTLLLFAVLDAATGARLRSAFVAAVFAVHPLHVESVAWIAERKDVLSTFFLLLAVRAHVAYARRPTRTFRAAVIAATAAGLAAKPMLVTLPFVLLLLDFWPLRRTADGKTTARALVVEKIPLFALVAASCVVTFLAQRRGGAVVGVETLALSDRALNALTSYVAYVGKTFWPTDLAALYPLHPESLRLGPALAAAAFLAGVTVVASRERTRRPWFLVGWLWFVGTLVPVIGLVQVGVQSMADRYMYVPMIGLLVVVAWGVADFVADRRALRVATAAAASGVVLACAVAARRQITYWKDGDALWKRATEVTSTGNVIARVNLGGLYFKEGKLDQAVAEFQEALRVAPNCAIARNDWGLVLLRQDALDAAREQFETAVRVDPDYAEAHVNLGLVLERQGRFAESVVEYRAALRVDPENGLAHNDLGDALGRLGKLDEAVAETNEALRIDPRNAAWRCNLAFLLQSKGDLVGAAREFDAALQIDPSNAEARRARDELSLRGVR